MRLLGEGRTPTIDEIATAADVARRTVYMHFPTLDQLILDATMRLLGEGRTPTIDEIATAADVARRTVYMHFPTLDQLILDASMGALAGSVVEAEFEPDADAADRVDSIVDSSLRAR